MLIPVTVVSECLALHQFTSSQFKIIILSEAATIHQKATERELSDKITSNHLKYLCYGNYSNKSVATYDFMMALSNIVATSILTAAAIKPKFSCFKIPGASNFP